MPGAAWARQTPGARSAGGKEAPCLWSRLQPESMAGPRAWDWGGGGTWYTQGRPQQGFPHWDPRWKLTFQGRILGVGWGEGRKRGQLAFGNGKQGLIVKRKKNLILSFQVGGDGSPATLGFYGKTQRAFLPAGAQGRGRAGGRVPAQPARSPVGADVGDVWRTWSLTGRVTLCPGFSDSYRDCPPSPELDTTGVNGGQNMTELLKGLRPRHV